ncbi:conserved hypothetical protein [Ricinus communis]|uniref:Uncharacterized protein n=1 Tax=Ricinus communis TaxID=3988 RepID=B9RUA2_RICCO|nr:conserved hypothetical protein [Ricinus communis]
MAAQLEQLTQTLNSQQTEIDSRDWSINLGPCKARNFNEIDRIKNHQVFPRYTKIDFPYFDENNDSLVWLNHCENFFHHQQMPEEGRVSLASLHLEEDA